MPKQLHIHYRSKFQLQPATDQADWTQLIKGIRHWLSRNRNIPGTIKKKSIVPDWFFTGGKEGIVEDPYIRLPHQVQNFVRFCEAVIKEPGIRRIKLITSCDSPYGKEEVAEKLADLRQSLLERVVILEVEWRPTMHDRDIRLDNGWVIKIGRGLDFYQKPDSWFEIGANCLSLRKCLETKVDIFKLTSSGK